MGLVQSVRAKKIKSEKVAIKKSDKKDSASAKKVRSYAVLNQVIM